MPDSGASARRQCGGWGRSSLGRRNGTRVGASESPGFVLLPKASCALPYLCFSCTLYRSHGGDAGRCGLSALPADSRCVTRFPITKPLAGPAVRSPRAPGSAPAGALCGKDRGAAGAAGRASGAKPDPVAAERLRVPAERAPGSHPGLGRARV